MSPAEAPDAALVVDASVALKWVVEEEGSEAILADAGGETTRPRPGEMYLDRRLRPREC